MSYYTADQRQPANKAEAGQLPAAGAASSHAAPHLQPCAAQRGLLGQDAHEGPRGEEGQETQGG